MMKAECILIAPMPVHNQFQDFADRHYEWFGGREHFGYLVRMARKFGIARCDEFISMMKHETKIANENRVKYFHACLHGKPKERTG